MLKHYKKIFLSLFALLFVLPQTLIASKTDSLKLVLSETHDINKKIEIYSSLSKEYKYTNKSEATRFAIEALKLSDQVGNEVFLRDIYGILGDIAVMNDSLDLARDYYLSALEVVELQNNKKGLIQFSMVLGNIAYVQDNLAEALKYYHKGIEYSNELGSDEFLDNLYLNIGAINFRFGNNIEAQEYFTKALESFIIKGDSLNIARAYSNLGLIYSELENYQEAELYFTRTIEMYQAMNDYKEIAHAYSSMSSAEQNKGNYQKAIDYLMTALDFAKKENTTLKGPRQFLLSIIWGKLGSLYLITSDYQQAFHYLQKAYNSGLANKQIAPVSGAAKGLATIYKEQKQFDSAYYFLSIHKKFSDSLTNTENIKNLAYQDARFEFEQQRIIDKQEREKEQEEQKRRKLLFIFVIVVLVLLLIVLVLFLKLGRNKVKRVELERETLLKELVLSQKELELRNKELTTHVLYQVKNNEFILTLSKKLKRALSKVIPENRAEINEVIRDIEQDTSLETWKEFELRFQNVHTGFYKKLSKNYPELTSNELRICAFLKLNMSTKDIAAITYQTTSSITVARWRLRKKFGLDKDENLVSFLAQI